jgi:hypothetical protein
MNSNPGETLMLRRAQHERRVEGYILSETLMLRRARHERRVEGYILSETLMLRRLGMSGESKDHDHIQRLARAPRRAGALMPRHLETKGVESLLNRLDIMSQVGKYEDQSLGGVHPDVRMKHRPPDLKYVDQVVSNEKIVR